MTIKKTLPLLLISLLSLLFLSCDKESGEEVFLLKISAAASLTDAMTEIAEQYCRTEGLDYELNFASSSFCARQIEAGMDCHLFLSANEKWVDYLQGHYLEESKSVFLRNSLVAVVPSDSKISFDRPEDFLKVSRIAMGDPSHVPAGMYGKKAFENMGIWEEAESRIVGAMDVRSALSLASSGAVDCAVVYKSDALIDSNVRVAYEFPPDDSGAIEYYLCRFGDSSETDRFYRYLSEEEAQLVFSRYGFSGEL